MLGSLVTFFLIGVIALVAASVVLALLGLIFSVTLSVAGFLLFKVLPIVLLGYLIVRFLAPRHKRIGASDAEWLDDA